MSAEMFAGRLLDMHAVMAARARLVDGLRQAGVLTNPRVEHAMRTVPRHLFVPNVSWQDAYRDQAVITKRDADGTPVSSASQPTIVAAMLEQLDVAPGLRVLEIGAGSGYNAALLSRMVGDGGQVTTIDIDPDIIEQAMENLRGAGFSQVRAVCGDGGLGFVECAPYDRIIVTAGAWDLPPAWAAQLAPNGRLVVPLSIRGAQLSVGFVLDHGIWHSTSVADCGFMPMRGPLGDPSQRVQISPAVWLQLENADLVDSQPLRAHLADQATVRYVPVTATAWEVVTTLNLWLAVTEPGYCRLSATVGAGLANTVSPLVQVWGDETFAPATAQAASLAYIAPRNASSPAPIEGQTPIQLEVRGHGPHGEMLAERLATKIGEWDCHDRPPTPKLRIDAYPLDQPQRPPAGMHPITKPNTMLAISWG